MLSCSKGNKRTTTLTLTLNAMNMVMERFDSSRPTSLAEQGYSPMVDGGCWIWWVNEW